MYTEFYDDPVSVISTMNENGEVAIRQLTWHDTAYMIVNGGRQWEDSEGRYALVEAADSTRFELQLSRQSLTWRVRKVWPRQMVV